MPHRPLRPDSRARPRSANCRPSVRSRRPAPHVLPALPAPSSPGWTPRRPTGWPSAGSGSPTGCRRCAGSSRPTGAPLRGVGGRGAGSCACPAPSGSPPDSTRTPRPSTRWLMLGFDHVEVGTVTGQPQPGNPRRRLFRLVADRALINRMGFNNDGSAAVAARLAPHAPCPAPRRLRAPRSSASTSARRRRSPRPRPSPTTSPPPRRLAAHADYLVVNVSSPNTPGLRALQATEPLRPLLAAVREAADRTVPDRRVPLLVKIAPDLADEDVDAVADLAVELGLDGIIATNTTIARDGLGLHLRAVPDRRDRRPVRRTAAGAFPGGAAPPVRTGRRPRHARRRRRRHHRRRRVAAHPRRAPRSSRATAPSSTRAPAGPARCTRGWRHGSRPARTPPSPKPSAPNTGRPHEPEH